MATIRNGNTALMVIDVQKDVVDNAWKRDEVVRNIVSMVDKAREAQTPVIFVQHEDEVLVKGSDGWQFVDEIAPISGEPVIAKHYLDAFAETGLPQVLEGLNISHLVICGAESMACIRATSHRALAEGYDLTLVEDAHTTSALDYADVQLSASQIIGYTNLSLQFTTYPGQETRVVPHDAVAFTAPTDVQETEHHVYAQRND